MDKRRQLPLPDGIAPSRRAPPALPVYDDAPPPPVPSRPTPGRPSPSAPAVSTSSRPVPRPAVPSQKEVPQDVYEAVDEPQEEYADCDFEPSQSAQVPDENYDEFEGVAEDDAHEVYDDMEVEDIPDEDSPSHPLPPQSSAPALPPPRPISQQTYDEFEGVGQDTYEIEEKQEEYQECDVAPAVTEEVYEITDADSPSPPPPPSSAPALPPPRPKHKNEETAAPPPPRNTAHKPLAPKGGVGTPAIAIGDIQNIKDKLKKVSVSKPEPEQKEPKVYTDSNELKAKFSFFKRKEQEETKGTGQSLLAKGNKPGISPKPASLIRKPVPVKEDQTDSPALPTRPDDKSIPSHRDVSDSLPPLPSPVNEDLPPLPPPLSEIPAHNRDLPPPPPTNPAMPQDLPPRGKDGYTQVNVGEEQNNNEDQDIYDDALSFEDPLLREKWYFGEIDRVVGSEKLKKFNQNGAYLLRKSTKGGNKQPYTLMVINENHVYNLKIRERNDKRVALGEEKPDEMSFKSVTDLIKHHQTNDVILVHKDGEQDTTLLKVSPPK